VKNYVFKSKYSIETCLVFFYYPLLIVNKYINIGK